METDEQFVERFREQWKATGNLVGANKHRLLALALRGAKVQWRPFPQGYITRWPCDTDVVPGYLTAIGNTLVWQKSFGERATHYIPLSALGEPEHE